MSLAIVEAEVRRFLADPKPEVLCIKGKWGVGKTFGWRAFLRRARENQALALDRYSYVSLFGLNSLDDLRYALFERTVSGEDIGEDPTPFTLKSAVKDRDIWRKFRPIAEGAAGVFNLGSVTDAIAKGATLFVREQIVCLDDLERAGQNLGTREILGLASLLKEERQCKVVLLLNDEQYDDKDEFDRQLEKVADVTLSFDPSPCEAAEIALDANEPVYRFLRPRFEELGITNIRVIKKIERLARRLYELLDGIDENIINGAIATLVLSSWSVQQPTIGPSIDFIRRYQTLSIHYHFNKDAKDPEFEAFESLIQNYPFRYADDLDHAVIEGAERGFFVEERIRVSAEKVQAELKTQMRDNALTRAWTELFHGSLASDDDEFLDAVRAGAIEDAAYTSASNINSAVYILRESDREEQAREVVAAYIEAHKLKDPEFFDLSNHFLGGDQVEKLLSDAFSEARRNFKDNRDPFEVLKDIGGKQTWGQRDLILMSQQTAEDFERMFEDLRGEEVKRCISILQQMGRSGREQSQQIMDMITEALRRIGAKSALRARKVANFGVVIANGDEKT